MSRRPDICTCQWSRVTTRTEDPPYIVAIDPSCPRHGPECVSGIEDDPPEDRNERHA
jgi:hypothetical protein